MSGWLAVLALAGWAWLDEMRRGSDDACLAERMQAAHVQLSCVLPAAAKQRVKDSRPAQRPSINQLQAAFHDHVSLGGRQ